MEKKENKFTTEVVTIIGFFVLFTVILLTFQFLNPSFLSLRSITTMLKTGSATAIAALGLTFVIVVNRSDISFYMTSCFSGMFMAWCIAKGMHPVIAVIGGLLVGAIWGFISGVAVGKFKLPFIISTIAIGSIAMGCAYIFSDGAFIFENFATSGITKLSEYRILGVTVSVYIMALFYIFASIILDKSKYGRQFYAIGSNEKATFFSGVKVNRMVIITYVICGMLAAMAAMINNAGQGQGNVKAGLSLLMPCFSAIYIGWSIFRRPCVIGTLFGSLLATVITTGFTVLSIPYYFSDLTMAVILIFAITMSKVDLTKKPGKVKAVKGTNK